MRRSNPSLDFVVIACGGTIDKGYSVSSADLQVEPPFFTDVASTFRATVRYEVVSLLRKDSLEMTQQDREIVTAFIANSRLLRFIVTHGTDSIAETARAIEQDHRISSAATIVLTGAFVPGRFSAEEACFNLGGAFIAAQVVSPGVYVVIGGEIYPARDIEKDRELERFRTAVSS